jgi:hypothetical protein
MVLAISSANYLFVIIPIILIYTALKKRCFIYGLFGINKNISIVQYYQSLIEKNNPHAICVFENDGEIVFRNNIYEEIFLNIKNIKEFNIKEESLISETYNDNIIVYTFVYKYENKYFSIYMNYLYEDEITLAYFTDISKIIKQTTK